MSADEGLALITPHMASLPAHSGLFLPSLNVGRGLGRQLNPERFYCAMRWNYSLHDAALLVNAGVQITAPNGATVWASPVDWGPNADTGRLIDVSPACLNALGVDTDDVVNVFLVV